MPFSESGGVFDRRRVGWWLAGVGLAIVVGAVVRSFIGTLVFGLFVYYAVRPIHRRLLSYADSRLAATVTTLVVAAVPLLLVLLYGTGLAVTELIGVLGQKGAGRVLSRVFGQSATPTKIIKDAVTGLSRGQFTTIVNDLTATLGAIGAIGGAMLRLSLALAFAFFLLQDGDHIDEWFRNDVASADSTAYAFLRGADADLETVYFGNVLTVIGVTLASILVYNAYNVVAPAAVSLPVPTLLALLTGLATFVPIVVGKLVYVPAAIFLFANAVRLDGSLVFPAGFLVVSFLLLDILPQTVIRPYISGQSLHSGLVLFGYVLGAAYFGWYGLFLGPLLVVLSVQFLKHVLPDLAGGEEIVPEPDEGVDIGSDPTATPDTTPPNTDESGGDATSGDDNAEPASE